MKDISAFVDLCKRVIADYDTGLVDRHLAVVKINNAARELRSENDVHPMLTKIEDLAFNILENYRTEAEDDTDWAIITKAIKNYDVGNWEPTCWILSAMYGEYAGERPTSSYSVAVRRQNGQTTVETVIDGLKAELLKVVKELNNEQTDERYLRNLAAMLPLSAGKYKLASVGVSEHLTEPFYK